MEEAGLYFHGVRTDWRERLQFNGAHADARIVPRKFEIVEPHFAVRRIAHEDEISDFRDVLLRPETVDGILPVMGSCRPPSACAPIGCAVFEENVQINAIVMGGHDVFAFAPTAVNDGIHARLVVFDDLPDAEGAFPAFVFTINGRFSFLHDVMHDVQWIVRIERLPAGQVAVRIRLQPWINQFVCM